MEILCWKADHKIVRPVSISGHDGAHLVSKTELPSAFTQNKIKSHLPDWLVFSHPSSHWKGKQEKLLFILSLMWNLYLMVPFWPKAPSWLLLNTTLTFHNKCVIILHQIKLLYYVMFSVSATECCYYFSSPLRPIKSWMLCLVLRKIDQNFKVFWIKQIL